MPSPTKNKTPQKTGNYDFHKDIIIANETEAEIAERLTAYGFETLEFNNDNQYDLLLKRNNKHYTLEIKEDFQVGDTGNVAVEYESRGKLSGIFTSKADLYMYKMHYSEEQGGVKYLLMTKKALIGIIKNKEHFKRVNGGDYGSDTMMYLFKAGSMEAISTFV